MKCLILFKSCNFRGAVNKLITCIILTAFITLTACRSKTKPPTNDPGQDTLDAQTFNLDSSAPEQGDTLQMKVLTVADSVSAFESEPHSPTGKIDLSFPIAVDKSENARYLNGEIKKMLAVLSGKSGGDSKEVAEAEVRQYLNEYKKDMAGMLKNSPDIKDQSGNFSPSMNYNLEKNISVIFNAHDYVILQEDDYDYSGGAHGNYGSFLNCFDLVKQRKLDLKDVLSIDSVTLQPIVEKYFREQYELKPDEKLNSLLFDEHLPANNNFYFNDSGIGFIYNPYEVASYAAGKIEVFIPFKALKSYLNPDFAKRIVAHGQKD